MAYAAFWAEFWAVDMWNNPVKKRYALPSEPICWPTHPASILVKAVGDVDKEIIERAESLGWRFNPITNTFYRED
jgi:hypothetical protein